MIAPAAVGPDAFDAVGIFERCLVTSEALVCGDDPDARCEALAAVATMASVDARCACVCACAAVVVVVVVVVMEQL